MMEKDGVVVLLVLLNVLFIYTDAFRRDTADRQSRSEGGFCRIFRTQTRGARRDGQNEFRLRVEGDPETYQPGSTYRVSLYASSPSYFRGFTLIALKEGREGVTPDDYAGTFKLIDESDTQFMTNCPPAVTESIPRRRTRIQVFWTAPPSGSGCVTLKASVVQRRIIFFQDEGSLTKRLCEKDPFAMTEKPMQECCACGTAKYRVTFYGNWSEKVHPRDYPRRANHWSALIGASHSRSYVLWEYGGFASEGVKQVAEYGSPVKMEEEIRQKGDDVMTVIKTKAQWPAWQPLNVRSAPSAEFSVDRARHLMSFLTMLGPSPDWNVGLSGEDLCTRDCGWVQRLVKDLVPWDAGTDSGVSYESPNKPSNPQERIRPLTKSLFLRAGLSVIVIRWQMVDLIRRCDVDPCSSNLQGEQCNTVPDTIDDIVADIAQEEKEEDNTPETCIYSNWSPWSACSSSTCDKGRRMRQRMLKAQLDPSVPCLHTQDFKPCMGPGCSEEEASTCMMSEWISWSPCSASCGMGMRSRERYVKQFPEDGSSCTLPTEETEKCVVNEDCYEVVCMLSPWSDWGECSVSCGVGMRSRQRMLKTPVEPSLCSDELEQVEKCMLPECPTDCMLSEWSAWSECNKSCGKGHMIRSRMVKLEPQFGGMPCPETVQRKKCRIRKCTRGSRASEKRKRQEASDRRRAKPSRESVAEESSACPIRSWSSWTECTKPCSGGIQERVMNIKRKGKSSQPNHCKNKEIRVCNVHPC
uniref:Spondin-1 n=1 Tax=Cyprinus carpio TaxID=7962 RepID=A0A8C1ZJ63_CYPCA